MATEIQHEDQTYHIENLPQGRHFYTTEYPEIYSPLTGEINFHGLVTPEGQALLESHGLDPLNFLLNTDGLAQQIIWQSEDRYKNLPRGAEGLTAKMDLTQNVPLAIKALYERSLSGFKNACLFPKIISPVFAKFGLNTIRYLAATPHALVRPWIDGQSLDVILSQLGETGDTIYAKLVENSQILAAHKAIFNELNRYLQGLELVPTTNPNIGKITQAKDQINGKTAARFSKKGEENSWVPEAQKIDFTVDLAFPDPQKVPSHIFTGLKTSRLSNWILAKDNQEIFTSLSRQGNTEATVNKLVESMICLDPFFIRVQADYGYGQ